MSGVPIIACGFLGLGIVLLLTPLILQVTARLKLTRSRDFHHTNQSAVPRLGGLALAAAFVGVEFFILLFLPNAFTRNPAWPVVLLGSLAMFGLGFWDDLKPLGAKKKLFGQIAIASAVWMAGIGIESIKLPFTDQVISLNGWGGILTVAWLVGFANLINLIDGVDGLAGGICLMLMGLLVYVAYQSGSFVLLSTGMAGALLGFLFFNFPPARIYLGDGGAYFLGFQIGLFSILNSHKGTVVAALIAPLFVLALPIVDTALAILRRGLRGLPVFRPDQSHIHHHLLEMGMSRRRVVLSLYGVTLVFQLMGFVAFWSRGHLVPGLLGLALLLLLLCAGKLSFTREWLAVGRTLGNSLGMRQQIQYALSLTNWIRYEGQRSGSLEDLFTDLAFAAHRLGFTSGSLTLADGRLGWSHPQACECFRSSHHELLEGSSGVLDLQAPVCQFRGKAPPGSNRSQRPCPMPLCGDLSDARLYQIMADLLAESWLKATTKWRSQGPLRFDMMPPVLTGSNPSVRFSALGHSRQPQEKPLPVLTRESVVG